MKARILIATCLLALALPAAAQAGLPHAKTDLIVPNRSIAGVALGDSPTAVQKAWGHTPSCEYTCIYTKKVGESETSALGSALLEKHGTKLAVWSVYIEAARKTVGTRTVSNFNTPLTAFKTAKGIGLGSKLSELKRAYPAAKKEAIPGGAEAIYRLQGPREVSTAFTTSAGRVVTIAISSHPGG